MNEQTPKDITSLKNFDGKTPIEIKTTTGIVELFPTKVMRGTGSSVTCVEIEGVCTSEVKRMSQCYVTFNSAQYGGNFSKVKESGGTWHVTFETILPVEE